MAEQEIVTTNFIASSVYVTIGGEQETGSTDAGKHKGTWGNLWK